MFGWLYKGIAKAVIDEASQYFAETMNDPKFQENMIKLIDVQVDRQKQRFYGQVGAMVRDTTTPNQPQPLNLEQFSNKDGSFNFGKAIFSGLLQGQQQRPNTQGSYKQDRKVYKYQ